MSDEPRVAIVSTSINPRPRAYAAWARQGDLIVAGDRNSPPELEDYVRELGGEYIRPGQQEVWPFSDALGWNCIQRRNVAVMTAYARGYDYVATVDDDNTPSTEWVQLHIEHLEGKHRSTIYVRGDDNWVDIGRFNWPPIRQRGTPFGVGWHHTIGNFNHPRLFASTAQVLGDPDCDAVMRIASDPKVTGVALNVIVHPRMYAAFNSQATLWCGEYAPLMAVLPEVGRYDDIFAGFIAERVMRERHMGIYAGEPCVTQERNAHSAIEDLRNELWGMENTRAVVEVLDRVELIPYGDIVDAYRACTEALDEVLPDATIEFMHSWCDTWLTYRSYREENRNDRRSNRTG